MLNLVELSVGTAALDLYKLGLMDLVSRKNNATKSLSRIE